MARRTIRNKNARRFAFSNILNKEVLTERLEERIVPAYVSGDFGWAGTYDSYGVNIEQHVGSNAVDSLGNIYQVGSFTGTVDFDPSSSTNNLTAMGGQDAFIEKFDPTGKLIWVKTFSGTASEKATSLTLDATGNPIITGWYQGTVDFDASNSVFNLTSQGAEDVFVAKLSANGVFLWAKSIGGSGSDQGFAITTDSASNILMAGKFSGTVDFDPSSNVSNLVSQNGGQDIFIAKYDVNGSCIWSKAILGADNNREEVYTLKTDSKNNVYVGGNFWGTLDLDPGNGVYSITQAGLYNGYFVRLDSSGNFSWGEQIKTGSSVVLSTCFDSSDNIYLSGFFDGTVDFDPSTSIYKITAIGNIDAFVQKLSPNGSLVWVKSWGGSGVDDASAIAVDINNLLKISGIYSSTVDFDPGINTTIYTGQGDYDYYVSVLDLNGNFYGVKTLGEPGREDRYFMSLNTSGQPVLTGSFSGTMDFDPDSPSKTLPVVGSSNFFITQWNRQFTKTTLALSDSLFGANTTLTATIQNENSTSSTGTVTFSDTFNGTTITLGTATVSNGVATLTLASMLPGVHNITAAYSGDSTSFSSTSYPSNVQLDAVSGSFGWVVAQVNRVGTEVNSALASTTHPSTSYANFDPQVKLTTDAQGNIYEATTSTGSIDFNPGTGSNLISSSGTRDLVLTKTGSSGTPLWTKQWKNTNNSTISIREVLNLNGKIAVVGSYTGTFNFDPGGSSSYSKTSAGNTDGFVMLFEANGTFISASTYGGAGNDFVQSYLIDPAGNSYIIGTFEGKVTFDQTSNTSLTSIDSAGTVPQPNNIFILKYSSVGSFIWAKSVQGTSNPDKALLDSNNNILILTQYAQNCDFDPGQGVSTLSNYGSALLKLDSNGAFVKVARINSSWPDGQNSFGLSKDSSGNIVVSGNVFFSGYPSATSFYVNKYDSALNELWKKEFALNGSSGNHPPIASVNTDAFNNIILTGFFCDTFDADLSTNVHNLFSSGQDDLFVAKYDSNFNYLSSSVIGGSGFEQSFSSSISPTGSVIVGGDFSSSSSNSIFTASAKYITDASLDSYIVDQKNVKKYSEWQNPPITYWGPSVNDADASLTYKFDFNFSASSISLKSKMNFWDFTKTAGGYGSGKGSIWVSADGQNYVNIMSQDYPSSGSAEVLYNNFLPASVLNTKSLWVQFRFYVTGAPNSSYTDAQFGRSTSASTTPIFELTAKGTSGVDFDPTSGIANLSTDSNVANSRSRFVLSLANMGPVSTGTTLTTNPTSSSVFGQSVTLNTALNALNGALPSGMTASFYDGATLLGTATVTNGIASFTTSSLAVGAHSFTAKIVDATNAYLTSTSTAVAFTVNKANTSTSVSASANPSTYGQTVTFIASVTATAPGAGTPTGTVTFMDGTTTLGTGTLNSSGVANYSISSLGIGSHSITAVYAGDSNDLASTSTALSQSVVAGSASSLTLVAGNSQSTTVAADFATLLQVKATDANGNPVANTSVTFTVVANGAGGSFASSSTVATNASGIATAPKLTANTVAGSFTVTASASGVANVVFNLTNTAGAASAIVLTAGNNQSTVVNTAYTQSLQAKVVDTYGNAVVGVPVTFGVPSTGATGSFGASNVVTTNAAGLAVAPVLTANTVAGAYQVYASSAGLTTQNFNLTNSPGAAALLTIQEGNNQSAAVGAVFAKTLQVIVKDTYGNVVPGVSVTFTAPANGASGTFGGSTTVVTNAGGIAASPVFTANNAAGAYAVTASATGVTTQNFSLTNTAGAASGFTIVAGNNQTVTVGNAFATALQVKITDSYGNGISGLNVQFTVSGAGASASFAGSNVVTTNSQGVAVAPTLTANTLAGSYSVIASVTGLSNQMFNLTNSTSGATIAIAGGNNQSATVGNGFGSALQVKFSDSFGNPVPGVLVTFAAPATGASGTFGGNTTVTSNAAGIATAPAFTANGKAGSFTVTASAANIGSVNFTLSNTAGAAASIVATSGNNQSATVNTAFGSPLIARVLDSYGNPVSGMSVTFSEPGSGALAVFGGSTVVTSNADGIVASPTLSANTVSGSYTVTASAANVNSAQFTLTNAAGLPTTIAKTGGNNQGAVANTGFTSPLSVKVSDFYGNPVPNVNVAFSGPLTGASLVFAGASSVSTNAQGVATTPAITANSVAGTYNVQVYVSGSVNESFFLTNLAGSVSKLGIFSGNYQTTTVNSAFAAPLQMQVTDAYGNAVSGATVNFSVPSSGAGVLMTGSSSATSNATGLVNWSSFVANKIAGAYVVTASIAGGGSLNFNLSNQAGAAAITTVMAGSNQSAIVNNVFNAALQVKVTDTFGNPVASVPVNFATPALGASAIFSGSTSVNTNADGVAFSPSFTANTIAGNYAATATVGSIGQSSFNLTNLAGSPAQVAKLSGSNQSAQVTSAFANPLQVKITDAWGNPVANVPVSFAMPSSGAGATLASTNPVTTNALGIATSKIVTANTVAGNFNVNVVANGNLNDSFSLTNIAGEASKLAVASGDSQFTMVNTAYTKGLQVLVTDAYNNPVANVPVTFNVPSTGASIVLAGGNILNTNAGGNALLDGFTANKVAGTFAVTAGVANIPSVNFNLNNNPGSVGSLVPVAGGGQSMVINGAFASALHVKVVDVYGNILPNVPVTFNSPGTGASLSFATNNIVRSDSTGLVSSPAMNANGVIGSYSVTVSTPGAPNINFTMSNAVPTIQSLVVQQGSVGRSFIRYVDLTVNDLGTVASIVNSTTGTSPRITLTNTGLTGTTKKAVVLKGLVSAIGNTIHIDFGTKGLGGNATSNAADGSYLISLDLDGNGSLETTQRFWRLLGDVNGDKLVDAKDTALVNSNLNKIGINLPGDTNGDGKVNSTDVSYVKKALKRKISL